MYDGGRIVRRVDALEGIANALAETKIFVRAPHAAVHRVRKQSAFEDDILSDLGKYDAHARILADGHIFPRGDARVL